MGKPLISVCIPVYNGAKFVGEALESVLAQSYENFEIIINDDHSNDDSYAIILSYNDSRIRVERNEKNAGAEVNWNRVLSMAKGKYIKLFHQDDCLDKDCLKEQMLVLENDPTLSFTFCSRDIVNQKSRKIMLRRYKTYSHKCDSGDILRRSVVTASNLIGEPSSVLFRKEFSDMIGGFDGDIPYLIDMDYWVRLMQKGSAYYIDKPLSTFRISNKSWSSVLSGQQGRQFVQFINKIRNVYGFKIGWGTYLVGCAMSYVSQYARGIIVGLSNL